MKTVLRYVRIVTIAKTIVTVSVLNFALAVTNVFLAMVGKAVLIVIPVENVQIFALNVEKYVQIVRKTLHYVKTAANAKFVLMIPCVVLVRSAQITGIIGVLTARLVLIAMVIVFVMIVASTVQSAARFAQIVENVRTVQVMMSVKTVADVLIVGFYVPIVETIVQTVQNYFALTAASALNVQTYVQTAGMPALTVVICAAVV